ncbi:ACP S-malonyltransferase, partial [Flavobacteriales bacterium]|nr:ACP S-malonyltransferase [Flavobacteriales bacterium]
MNVFVFPGQGSQFPGMGKELYSNSKSAKKLFDKADKILGFSLSKIMFEGTDEDLKRTKVTQPAIFVHSIAKLRQFDPKIKPDFVAGHSLGEFSALVANGTINFDDGLKLVSARANAMQKACENNRGTMAAILGLDDKTIINECEKFNKYVVAANLNCPGQVVISGEFEAIKEICILFNNMGAKRSIQLSVSGAFHSELMGDAKKEL